VARVHFRGHVNRHLRGLGYPPERWAAEADARPGAGPALVLGGAAARQAPAPNGVVPDADGGQAAVPPGASLVDEADKVVGDVRSSTRSPRLGGVALGMVRREVPLGAVLRARWTDADGVARERGVTVTALPFPL
jgi:hypothetical protein